MKLHHQIIRRLARGSVLIALGLSFVVAPATRLSAQSNSETERPRQLTEVTQEAFNKVWPLIEAKNWETVIPLLNDVLAKAKPDSYDTAMASVILAQVYLQRNTPGGSDYAAAIPLLETTLRLAYHDEARILEFMFLVAQLQNIQGNPARAEELAMQWLERAPQWKNENVVFACSILLQRAQSKDNTIDKEAVHQAIELVRKAMLVFPNPTEQLYQIQAISYQLNDEYAKAAEIFEVLVSKWPKNRQYWQQLYALYVNSNESLRAVLTLERAQELGILNSTKENLSRVGLYYNLQRFDRVTDILEKGLNDGSIDNEPNNWELLAAAYQQTYYPEKAIHTYERAAERFPASAGKYNISITNLYWEMKNYPEALKHIELGLAAGDVENPGKLYMFGAYICFELRRYQKGLELLEKAKPLIGEGLQQQQEFRGLTDSINDAISREQAQAAAGAARKS